MKRIGYILGVIFPHYHPPAQGTERLIKLAIKLSIVLTQYSSLEFYTISSRNYSGSMKNYLSNPPWHRHCPIRQDKNVPHIPLLKLGF